MDEVIGDPGHLLPQENWDQVVKEAKLIQALQESTQSLEEQTKDEQ